MLNDQRVLIVEDNVYLAMDIASAVEDLDGRVAGPVATVADALQMIGDVELSGAVLDYELPSGDVLPVARALVARRVPFVIHACTMVAPEMAALRPGAPVLIKPIQPEDLVAILAHEVLRSQDAG